LSALAERNPEQFQGVVTRVLAAIDDKPKLYEAEKDPILQSPQLMDYFRSNPDLLEQVQDPRRRALIKQALKRAPASK
jgi:hypothetical protein